MRTAITTLLCLAVSGMAGGWDLVRDGAAEVVIVTPDDPLSVESYAASELQYIVEKASGVRLPIATASAAGAGAGNRVLLGRAAGLELDGLPPAGFRVRSSEAALELAGVDGAGKVEDIFTAAGTLYAVYEWAERELGVRWLWPDELGEMIPARTTIQAGGHDLSLAPKLRFASVRKFDWRWRRRLLRADLSRYPIFAGCSSQGHAFIDWFKRYGKDHPEFFELDRGGNRVNDRYGAMCVSNPELHRQIVENWRAANRPDRGVNAKENDAHGRCLCETCQSWDGPDFRWPTAYYSAHRNVGERYARFYKAIRDLAAEINPDVEVGGYAYMNYVYAPRATQLHKNIIVGFVDDLPYPRTPEYQKLVDDEIEQWNKSGATLYFRPNTFYNGYAMPEIWFRQYAGQFLKGFRNGMVGLDVDGPNNSWATAGPNLYVMSRLAIDPERPADELFQEFCSGFGKARPAVERYFEYWEKYTMDRAAEINRLHEQESQRKWFFYGFHYAMLAHRFFPASAFAPAGPMLDEAAKLAAGDPTMEERVRFLRQGFDHAKLCSETSAIFADPATDNVARGRAVEKLKEFRKTLLPCVADTAWFETGQEKNAWTMRDIDLKDAIALPEHWRTMLDPENRGRDAGFFRKDFQDADWTPRSAWTFLENQGVEPGSYRFCWYRQTVKIPSGRKGWRAMLRLGAIDESGWTWVNGRPVGELIYDAALNPNSWQEPQEYDITDAVKFGEDNHIAVRVENAAGNGGLWKPSYIRFERAGTGERTTVVFPVNARYASRQKAGGADALKLVGRPDLPDNDWLKVIAPLPYKDVGGAYFRLKASIKTENLGGGEFLVVLRMANAAGATITYDGFTIKENHDWRDYARDIKIRDNAVALQAFAVARKMGGNSAGWVKDVTVERLHK